MSEAAAIEQEIIARLSAAKLRLRFDKVALRLVDRLKVALAGLVPQDQAMVFTVTAPIKLPAKTAAAIEGLVHQGLPAGEVHGAIHGNQVRLRVIAGVPAGMPRVVGFVHNPESSSDLILDLTEARLRGQS